MFGLESQSSKKKDEFLFELEEEMKDPNKYAKIKDKIHNNLLKIKALLRSGAVQDDFEHLGHLVYGYTALLKVVSKASSKKQ